jgi:hypothetical protein
MPTIEELFTPHTARSSGFDAYEAGEVAFVTNGLRDNGIQGFVKPFDEDRVFDFVGIVLSAFLEATVQVPPFIARGNGGSGLLVLEPQASLTPAQLGFVAAYVNTALSWRFSWYRQTNVDRVRRLVIPDPRIAKLAAFSVGSLLPTQASGGRVTWTGTGRRFPLGSIYELRPGDYHSVSDLQPGSIPIVSCGDADNGISGFVDVEPDHIYEHRLTIAFNGMNTLTAKYHPYQFAAKDDVAICRPFTPLRVSTQLFIQVMLNRERWRYSYYRKCFMNKLKRFSVLLPSSAGRIDENVIEAIMATTPYWPFLKSRLG